MIKLVNANFLRSATNIKNTPPPQCTEIAFLGRSNVGKSTLINTILKKPLAKSSSTPGKTQLINFFQTQWDIKGLLDLEQDSKQDSAQNLKNTQSSKIMPLSFIDLPGFGYAKVSKEIKKSWQKHLLEFIVQRKSIKLFLYLIDSRHTNMPLDNQVKQLLQSICQNDQSVMFIYTKVDKLTQNQIGKLKQQLDLVHCPYAFTSTISKSKFVTPLDILTTNIIKKALGYGI